MSRQSTTLDLLLEDGVKIRIGDKDVILTAFTADVTDDSNKLPVKEIYVSKTTGNLVIVYDDGE